MGGAPAWAFWPHPPRPQTRGLPSEELEVRAAASTRWSGQKKTCLPTPHSGEQTPSNRKMTEEPSERDGMLNMSAGDIRPERKWKGAWGRLCKTALVLRGLWAWPRSPLVGGTQSCDAGRGTGRAPRAGLALSCCQAAFRLHLDKPRLAS